jgi:hypothetical protein
VFLSTSWSGRWSFPSWFEGNIKNYLTEVKGGGELELAHDLIASCLVNGVNIDLYY